MKESNLKPKARKVVAGQIIQPKAIVKPPLVPAVKAEKAGGHGKDDGTEVATLPSEKTYFELAKKDFALRFPHTVAKWEKFEKYFLALFDHNGEKHSARFDPSGRWLSIENNLERDAFTQNMANHLNAQYPGHTILGLKSQFSDQGKSSLVQIEHKGDHYNVHFNDSGDYLRHEKK
jgi:hypothetical protein